MKKHHSVGKANVQRIGSHPSNETQNDGFKSYDDETFCAYTACELVTRFRDLHGERALFEAEYYLELAINSNDRCQIETWTYLISVFRTKEL